MTTPPAALCATCHARLYPHLARRTEAGWVHANRKTCSERQRRWVACTDCGIRARTRTGLCRTCRDRRDGISPAELDPSGWVRDGLVWRWAS